MRIRMLMFIVMMCLVTSGLLTVIAPRKAEAIPAFSRQTGKSCTTCHSAVPKLNQTGQNFRLNGFRFPEDKEWNEVQDLKHVPLSVEIEVEGEINKADKSAQTSQLKIDEVELMAGTPLGKDGRFSGYSVLSFAEGEVGVGQAYGQINDLIGETGHGLLNLKVGQFEIAQQFLSSSQRVIKQRYFAQSQLGILGARAGRGTVAGNEAEAAEFFNTAIELNGQIVGKEATDLTHQYAFGLYQPQDLNDQNKLGRPGFYASYAVNFLENFHLGAIYKRDVVNTTLVPGIPNAKHSVNKWGVSGDAKFGPLLATFGYFRSDGLPNGAGTFANGDTGRALQNYMGEILFIPNKKWVVGVRVDHIDQELAQSGTRTTVMGRYNILPNVYFQAEYRVTDAFNNGTDTLQGRAFLVALF